MKSLFAAAAAATLSAGPALAQEAMAGMDHSKMDHAAMDHAQMGHAQAGRSMMSGALGAYPMTREASGTAWQPDVSPHEGMHIMSGPWMVMLHATINGVYDWQQGPRGDEKTFASGMLMGSAKRDVGDRGTVQFRGMLSPDPFMGKRGYPLLLATGETADGVNHLVDRQHPHDLVMELSGSYSHSLTERDSVFVYAGLPGEPAFGPPAFMHRLSIMDSPAAPISHHWLDSTHITFGVLTAGYVHDNWKVEASRFHGREPDQHRFDIERPKFDSSAVRLSYNPTPNWALQASWADVKSPEQLEPAENVRRWSASAIYTVPVGDEGWWSTTAAWGRRTSHHGDLDALVLESAVKLNAAWTIFSRAEHVDSDELGAGSAHVAKVGKLELGAVRDWALSQHVSLGVGGLYAVNVLPGDVAADYGRRNPTGAMGFVRLKLR